MTEGSSFGPKVGPIRYWIGKLWLKAFGWQTVGEVPPIDKAVFVANPHTTGWDLPFTLAVAWSLRMNVSWAGKSSLFRGPLKYFFRALGGVSIERSKRASQVDSIAEAITREDRVFLVIAPAGTRKRRDHWKSGFYHIARKANVPMLLAFMDYSRKRGGLGPAFTPTGDIRADMNRIRAFYDGVEGKYPNNASIIRLREEDDAVAPMQLAEAAE
ncbi:MAG: lysophospholipid acyltransferase family protein [Deltaproteobacteria bacterium]|nr:lysophospholipid acyltransferase family protein [Deltaproteobacteria bacterium]